MAGDPPFFSCTDGPEGGTPTTSPSNREFVMTSDASRVAGVHGLSGPPFFSHAAGPEGCAPAALPSSHTRPCHPPFFPSLAAQTEVMHRTKAELHWPMRKVEPHRRPPELLASSPFRGNQRS